VAALMEDPATDASRMADGATHTDEPEGQDNKMTKLHANGVTPAEMVQSEKGDHQP